MKQSERAAVLSEAKQTIERLTRERNEARAAVRLELARHPRWGRPWMAVSDADVDSVIEGAAELGVKAWEEKQ